MTEEDAKKKWCPKAITDHHRAGYEFVASINRGGKAVEAECRCCASDCMAWRWLEQMPEQEKDEIKTQEARPEGDGWVQDGCCNTNLFKLPTPKHVPVWKRPIPREGFCGLAGMPCN